MPLSPLDDFLAHQTTEPFAHVFTSDRNFYDRYYFNLHASSDEIFAVFGMGQYPNLGVTDAFLAISHGTTQTVVRASRELGHDRLDTGIGPFRVEVVEGLRKLRLTLDDNEWGVGLDVVFDAVSEATEEPKHQMRQFGRVTMDTSRYAQLGAYTGTLTVAGKTYEVAPDRWKGVRDRSWGVRPVGEPEPPGIRVTAQPRHGFFHHWIPAQFDDFTVKLFFEEDAEGERLIEEASVIPHLGSAREPLALGSPRHEMVYRSGGREIERTVVRAARPDGEDLVLTCHPLRTVYLAAGSGYLPAGDWGHGQYRGPLVVQGLTYDMGDPAVRKQYALLNETLCRFELATGEVGYGMHENMVLGIYRPHGFEAPDAVSP